MKIQLESLKEQLDNYVRERFTGTAMSSIRDKSFSADDTYFYEYISNDEVSLNCRISNFDDFKKRFDHFANNQHKIPIDLDSVGERLKNNQPPYLYEI